MKFPVRLFKISLCIFQVAMVVTGVAQQHPSYVYAPKTYACLKTDAPFILDGKLDETQWQKAEWTSFFVDIEGDVKPAPYYNTRVKMLWDNDYLYIGAELEEENLWATFTKHDAVIFHENNFEVFLDPEGDTHNYLEMEINALGTYWDLYLTMPYRDKGKPVNGWEIVGFKKGIHLNGTLNTPGDRDGGWSVELAFPWSSIGENIKNQIPEYEDIWRANFSRVEWKREVKNGEYIKAIDPETNEPYPEDNWVWSPQGAIAMHQPETWGYVQFKEGNAEKSSFKMSKDQQELEKQVWALRNIYYKQHEHFEEYGSYASSLKKLGLTENPHFKLYITPYHFEALYEADGYTLMIGTDGQVRKTDH